MNEIKERWLKALRSGEYKQCKGQLTDGEGFCCLGVLADIEGINIPKPNYSRMGDDEEDGNWGTYMDIKLIIPNHVWLKGIEMNDEGYNFLEIADMIEEKWV